MSSQLIVRDTSLSGETVGEWSLDFLSEKITVRELIRSRVYQEVQDYNRSRPDRSRGLIEPSEDERLLNGEKPPRLRPIDWQRQFDRALTAFRNKQVLIFVGDRQAEQLDECIDITPGTQVSFLRLTLLTGG